MCLLNQADVSGLEQPEENCPFLPVILRVGITEPPSVPRGNSKAGLGRSVTKEVNNVGERCPAAEIPPSGAPWGRGPETKQP